jgi:hypothetical protein
VAARQQTPRSDQIRVVELGHASGVVINGGIHWQVPLLAFVLTLGASCSTVIFFGRVRRGWELAAREEQSAEPLEVAPTTGR